MDSPVSYLSVDYLSKKFPLEIADENYCVNSRFIPDTQLLQALKSLGENEILYQKGCFVGGKIDKATFHDSLGKYDFSRVKLVNYHEAIRQIIHITDIYQNNPDEIIADFNMLDKTSGILPCA